MSIVIKLDRLDKYLFKVRKFFSWNLKLFLVDFSLFFTIDWIGIVFSLKCNLCGWWGWDSFTITIIITIIIFIDVYWDFFCIYPEPILQLEPYEVFDICELRYDG
jgi:hypothetical protein